LVRGKLTTSANDSDEAEYESEDPARTATESMTAADDDCNKCCGYVDAEFKDGNSSLRVELHEGLVFILVAG